MDRRSGFPSLVLVGYNFEPADHAFPCLIDQGQTVSATFRRDCHLVDLVGSSYKLIVQMPVYQLFRISMGNFYDGIPGFSVQINGDEYPAVVSGVNDLHVVAL